MLCIREKLNWLAGLKELSAIHLKASIQLILTFGIIEVSNYGWKHLFLFCISTKNICFFHVKEKLIQELNQLVQRLHSCSRTHIYHVLYFLSFKYSTSRNSVNSVYGGAKKPLSFLRIRQQNLKSKVLLFVNRSFDFCGIATWQIFGYSNFEHSPLPECIFRPYYHHHITGLPRNHV